LSFPAAVALIKNNLARAKILDNLSLSLKPGHCPLLESLLLLPRDIMNKRLFPRKCPDSAGLEYQASGLGAAIITHWMYDWFAFYYICREWGTANTRDEISDTP